MQGAKKRNSKFDFTPAVKDLVVIAVVSVIVFILSYFFNVFIFIVKFLQQHPDKIGYVDEIIVGLLVLSISFAIFSWRRWLELKKETAKRLRLEKELVKAAETRAEIEKIINRQLQCEIELRKQE